MNIVDYIEREDELAPPIPVVECICGEEVACWDMFTNECDCGELYNGMGQHLKPYQEWEDWT